MNIKETACTNPDFYFTSCYPVPFGLYDEIAAADPVIIL